MAEKLTNVSKNCKAYWAPLRRLLNNIEIPLILPLFHENKFLTDFKEKSELYNSHFASQCSLKSRSSKLPLYIQYLTDNRLSCVSFSHGKIAKVLQNLDPNKAHGQDNISTRMLKVYGRSIYKPLEVIFNQCLETGVFPFWCFSVRKEGDKQTLKNSRSVSLIPICGKILEGLIFNEMFEFFIENKLIFSSQSGFKPGDSCINQLLSITQEIYSSFDEGLEVRSVFLDI